MSLRRSRVVRPAAGMVACLLAACGLEVVGTAPVFEPSPDATVPSLPEAGPLPEPVDASVDQSTGVVPCKDAGTCPEAGSPVKLTVAVTGSTKPGLVTASTPAITCPGTCSGDVPAGTKVTLTVDPPVELVLVEWSVASCGRELTCEVTVNGPLTVTARFGPALVYVHDNSRLYRVDPITGAPNQGVLLSGCGTTHDDIAIDRNNAVVLASQSSLFTLNPVNGQCGNVRSISDGGNCSGLGFMPDPSDPSKDTLFAGCGDSLYRLNRSNGQRTLVGAFGGGYSISGDIAWVPGKGLYGTFTKDAADDVVARIDTTTGAIGSAVDTGRTNVYGLARRGKKLLGLGDQEIFEIDPDTGAVQVLSTPPFQALGGTSGP